MISGGQAPSMPPAVGRDRLPEFVAARALRQLSEHERINFLLTNRIPRQALTRLVGWFSTIENAALTRMSIAVWRFFATDLDFSEAEKSDFVSLRDCFTRKLKEGARPVDARPEVVVSPCDAIIGACGRIDGTRVFQAKGFPYEIGDLIPDPILQERYRDGVYATLRLTSSMYHRFHAPADCRVESITYISGDTWNVNPIALRRVERLFCKNERAVVDLVVDDSGAGVPHHGASGITLVPVAAILVASMRFHCLPEALDLAYRGPNRIACSARYRKGDEMGFFQQGSTILVFATADHRLAETAVEGARITMGRELFVKDSAMP